MTWGRAMLLQLVTQYVAKRQALEPWEDASGASHLEIQKLMYFASHYEQTRPWLCSRKVRPVQRKSASSSPRNGRQLSRRFRRRRQPRTGAEPHCTHHSRMREGKRYLATHATTEQETINKVLQLIEGFESPYGTELLASTHWS